MVNEFAHVQKLSALIHISNAKYLYGRRIIIHVESVL